jgi:plasmid maintenance system antidote protein VapI
MKKVSVWQEKAVRARKNRPESLNQEAFARMLGLSTSEVRRWEQGTRAPTEGQAILLGKVTGPPDCWFWWELAGLSRREIERALVKPASSGAEERTTARYSEDATMALHQALDIILDNAPSTVVEKVSAMLDKFAGQHGDPPKSPR